MEPRTGAGAGSGDVSGQKETLFFLLGFPKAAPGEREAAV